MHSAGICDSNVSVCPSVTAGIVSKRRELASWFLHLLSDSPMISLAGKVWLVEKFARGHPPSEGDLWDWGEFERAIFAIFRPKPPYLRNGARYDQGYYWTLIGNRIRAFDWYQNQRLWMTLNWPWTAIMRTHLSFGARHHINMTEDRPILSAAKM